MDDVILQSQNFFAHFTPNAAKTIKISLETGREIRDNEKKFHSNNLTLDRRDMAADKN